jgi:hypothetical protein
MSYRIAQILRTLKPLNTLWSWEFGYAPLPGVSQIKIAATHKYKADTVKVLYITTALLEELPLSTIAQILLSLLELKPDRAVLEISTAKQLPANRYRTYEDLRAKYKAELKMIQAGANNEHELCPRGEQPLHNNNKYRSFR